MQDFHLKPEYSSKLNAFIEWIRAVQSPSSKQLLEYTNRLSIEFSSNLPFLLCILEDINADFTAKHYACFFIKENVSKRRERFSDQLVEKLLFLIFQGNLNELIQTQILHILSIIAKKNIHFLEDIQSLDHNNSDSQNTIDFQFGQNALNVIQGQGLTPQKSKDLSQTLSPNSQAISDKNAQKTEKMNYLLRWKNIINELLQRNGILAMKFVQVLCVEFSSQKISVIRLTFIEHEESRKLFQQYLLEDIFLLTMKVIEKQNNDIKCLSISFNILQNILTWDFSASINLYRSRFIRGKSTESDAYSPPKLSPMTDFWSQNLSSNHFLDILETYLKDCKKMDQISHPIRQCLIRLSQMCPTSMSSMMSLAAASNYYSRIFRIHIELCSSGLMRYSNEESAKDILCGAESLKNLIFSLPLGQLFSLEDIMIYIQELSNITYGVLEITSKDLNEYIQESLDHLLLAWELLISKIEQFESASTPGSTDTSYFHSIQKLSQKIANTCAPKITKGFIESQIISIGNELNFENCTEDRLRSAIALPRICIPFSINIFKKYFEERFSYIVSSVNDNSELYIKTSLEVSWLLKFFSYIIADNSDSEQPFIPSTVMKFTSSPDGISFIMVVEMILKLAEIENQRLTQQKIEAFHPKVSESLAQFFDHFSSTYIMPDTSNYEDISPIIIEKWGHNENGKRVVSFMLQKVIVNIYNIRYSNSSFDDKNQSENDVANATCKLLATLVGHSSKRDYLVTTTTWKEFLIQDRETYTSLVHHSNAIKSKITELLCRAYSGYNNTNAISEYFAEILLPIQNQLYSILQSNDFEQTYSNEDTKQKIDYCLHKCIGVARASDIGIWEHIFAFFSQYNLFSTFSKLIQIYSTCLHIETGLFKFFFALVEKTVVFLNRTQFTIVSESFLHGTGYFVEKMRGYSFINNPKDENEFKKCIILIIQVLNQIMSRELFSDYGESNYIIEILFNGLSHLLMLITPDMLEYPKLRREYYVLLSSMMEIYPIYFLSTPQEVVNHVIQSLKMGIEHFEPDIIKWSYQAIKSCVCTCIRIKNEGGKMPNLQNEFKTYLHIALNQLLFETLDVSVLPDLSKGLCSLIIWDQVSYYTIASDLIRLNPDRKLQEAFMILQENITNINRIEDESFLKSVTKFMQMAQISTR